MRAGTTRRWISTMNSSPVPNRGDVVLVDYPMLVYQRMGILSASLMSQIDACLKAALNVT